jgi:hypothetical protein
MHRLVATLIAAGIASARADRAITNPASTGSGTWAASGQIPEVDGSGAISPDGTYRVVASDEGLSLIDHDGRAASLAIVATPPLWEVVWSPDSRWFAVNFSDGGVVGTWDVAIYAAGAAGKQSSLVTSASIRKSAQGVAHCESPEELNIGLVSWAAGGKAALLVAEVPSHSSCKNMGAIFGFDVSVDSGKILGRRPERTLRQTSGDILGCRFASTK